MTIDLLDEIYLRAAVNLMRDAVESERSPSGLPLDRNVSCLYERAAHRFEVMVREPYVATPVSDETGEQSCLMCLVEE